VANFTWVCFDCRRSDRMPHNAPDAAPCALCRGPMRCLGSKARIPGKGATAAWEKLRTRVAEKAIAADRDRKQATVRRRHALEHEIAALEAKPKNRDRAREIKRLQTALDDLIRGNSG
jgi:hypothetical protein